MTTPCPLHTYMHTDCKNIFLLASPDLCSQLPQSLLLGCASEQRKKKTRGRATDMMTATSDDSPQPSLYYCNHMLESLLLSAQVAPSMLAEFLECQV